MSARLPSWPRGVKKPRLLGSSAGRGDSECMTLAGRFKSSGRSWPVRVPQVVRRSAAGPAARQRGVARSRRVSSSARAKSFLRSPWPRWTSSNANADSGHSAQAHAAPRPLPLNRSIPHSWAIVTGCKVKLACSKLLTPGAWASKLWRAYSRACGSMLGGVAGCERDGVKFIPAFAFDRFHIVEPRGVCPVR